MKGLLRDRVVSQAEFDRAMAEEKQTRFISKCHLQDFVDRRYFSRALRGGV